MIKNLICACLAASESLSLENLRLFLCSSFSREADGKLIPYIIDIRVPSSDNDSNQLVFLPRCAITPVSLLGVESFNISGFAQITRFKSNLEQSKLYLRPISKRIRQSNRSTYLSIQLRLGRMAAPEGVQRIVDNLSKACFDKSF